MRNQINQIIALLLLIVIVGYFVNMAHEGTQKAQIDLAEEFLFNNNGNTAYISEDFQTIEDENVKEDFQSVKEEADAKEIQCKETLPVKDEVAEIKETTPITPTAKTSVSRGQTIEVYQSTAYTWTGDKTATGTWPEIGTIAVDPSVIPLGTTLWVEGYGYGIAADTGGLIKGHVIDVFFPTEEECMLWGRRNVVVKRI